MKKMCNVVRDILPLYQENMVSADTAAFVAEHLADCETCTEELEKLNMNVDTQQEEQRNMEKRAIKSIKKRLKRREFAVWILATVVALAVAAAVCFVPIPKKYENSFQAAVYNTNGMMEYEDVPVQIELCIWDSLLLKDRIDYVVTAENYDAVKASGLLRTDLNSDIFSCNTYCDYELTNRLQITQVYFNKQMSEFVVLHPNRFYYVMSLDAPENLDAVFHRLYQPDYKPLTEMELTQFSDMFTFQMLDEKRLWYNYALKSLYTSAADVNLFDLFYSAPMDESPLTDEELSFLKQHQIDPETAPIHRYTRETIDSVLKMLYGITLEQSNAVGLDRMLYNPERDCYYHQHGDFLAAYPILKRGVKLDNGLVWIYYTTEDNVLKRVDLQPQVDGTYRILKNIVIG